MTKTLTPSWCQRPIPTSVKTVLTSPSITIPLVIRSTDISWVLDQPVIQLLLNHLKGPAKGQNNKNY